MQVNIGVSNRHIHLTEEHLKILFGDNFSLTKNRDIKQPGQYASTSTVTIETNKDKIENVRVLGPLRDYTQVEISRTDAFKLGLNPPIRVSGEISESAPITIVGPVGTLELEDGCILANRHIHITKEQRKEHGLEGITEVKVKIDGIKGGILDHVYLKESEEAYFEMHLDTDDANAHFVGNGDIGEILIEK